MISRRQKLSRAIHRKHTKYTRSTEREKGRDVMTVSIPEVDTSPVTDEAPGR